MNWNDFNDAADQSSYDLIPKGTIAKVRMTIRPGGYDDLSQGWTDGYATKSDSGAVYLSCEFIILEGASAHRKIWSLIGLYSPKGETWAAIGRGFIKAILNSAYNLHPKDDSPATQAKRCIKSFRELDGIEFLARVDIGKGRDDSEKNEIRTAITPEHKNYAELMGIVPTVASATINDNIAPVKAVVNNNLPGWAQ